MARNKRYGVDIDLSGNVASQAKRFSDSIRGISDAAGRANGRFSRFSQRGVNALDRVGNRVTGILAGAAVVKTVRDIALLERELTRLGNQSKKSEESMEALRKSIYANVRASDVNIDPAELFASVNAIVDKFGDLEFAENNLRSLALAIQATGADGMAMGNILGDLREKFELEGNNELSDAMSLLIEQGKAGSFPLRDMANLGPRILAAYSSLGRKGMEAVRESGAMIQVFRTAVGSSEQAATAFEAVISDIKTKADKLNRRGIKLFANDADEAANKMRPLQEILADIFTRYGGSSVKMTDIFGNESGRAINALLKAWDAETRTFENIEKFTNVVGDMNITASDSARAAKDSLGQWQALKNTWDSLASTTLLPVLNDVGNSLSKIDPTTLDKAFRAAIVGAGGLLALTTAAKGANFIGSLFGGKGQGPMSGRGLPGGVSGPFGKATPVYVTNMGSWGGGNGYTGGPSTGSSNSKNPMKALPGDTTKAAGVAAFLAKYFGKFYKFAAKAAPWTAVAATGYDLYSDATDDSQDMSAKIANIMVSGGLPVLGATIGSIVPGAGTWAGYYAGSAIEMMVGDSIAPMLAEFIRGKEETNKNEEVKVNLTFDAMSVDSLLQGIRVTSGSGPLIVNNRALP